MATAKVTTDHRTIRRWAEALGGTPAVIQGTGTDHSPGVLRFDFPDAPDSASLEHISWEMFFDSFDQHGLALLYRDGERFNRLVSRKAIDPRIVARVLG
jgi:hypothetical protein